MSPQAPTSRAGPLWRTPLVLAALTLAGLVAGLLGEGWFDVLAGIGLGIPVLLCLYKAA